MVASGGVASLDDVRACMAAGLAGVIVGKALYEGRLDLADAVKLAKAGGAAMPAKRIIPCLDVKNGRVVKGINFQNLRDAGDPVEAAARYDAQGADEVTYLDIAATLENRGTLVDLVTRHRGAGLRPADGGRRRPERAGLRAAPPSGADKV